MTPEQTLDLAVSLQSTEPFWLCVRALQRFIDVGISGMFLSRTLMVQLLTMVFLVGSVANGWILGRPVLEQCFVSVLDHFRRSL